MEVKLNFQKTACTLDVLPVPDGTGLITLRQRQRSGAFEVNVTGRECAPLWRVLLAARFLITPFKSYAHVKKQLRYLVKRGYTMKETFFESVLMLTEAGRVGQGESPSRTVVQTDEGVRYLNKHKITGKFGEVNILIGHKKLTLQVPHELWEKVLKVIGPVRAREFMIYAAEKALLGEVVSLEEYNIKKVDR